MSASAQRWMDAFLPQNTFSIRENSIAPWISEEGGMGRVTRKSGSMRHQSSPMVQTGNPFMRLTSPRRPLHSFSRPPPLPAFQVFKPLFLLKLWIPVVSLSTDAPGYSIILLSKAAIPLMRERMCSEDVNFNWWVQLAYMLPYFAGKSARLSPRLNHRSC